MAKQNELLSKNPCFESKVDSKVVQQLMGHVHYSIMVDIYTYVVDEKMRDECGKFEI